MNRNNYKFQLPNQNLGELTGIAIQLGCQWMQRWDQLSNFGANPYKKQRKLNYPNRE